MILHRSFRGSITLMVLVFLVSCVIIITASLQFLGRQSHQITDQGQTEKAFDLADSGVEYAVWLLQPKGGGFTAESIAQKMPDTAINHAVTDSSRQGMVLGYFSLLVTDLPDPDTGEIKITSVGRSVSRLNDCQIIEAVLRPFQDKGYRATTRKQIAEACASVASLPPLPTITESPGATPTATPTVSASTSASPTPTLIPNDRQINATAITSAASFADEITDTETATLDGSPESRACYNVGRTVWYKITPAADSVVTVSTLGSSFDTAIGAYVVKPLPGPGIMPNIGCDDNGGQNLTSSLDFLALRNATYYIQVGGKGSAFGNLKVSITQSACISQDITVNATPASAATLINMTWSGSDCQLNGQPLQVYRFPGAIGQQLDVSLDTTAGSSFTAPTLSLYESVGYLLEEESNCSAGFINNKSCLNFQFDSNDTYTLAASRLSQALNYQLKVNDLYGTCPIGYWRFDAVSNSATLDASGNGRKLYLQGDFSLANLSFPVPAFANFVSMLFGFTNPGTGYSNVPINLASNTLTFSVWVKHASTPGIQRYISLNNETAVLRRNGSQQIEFYIKGIPPGLNQPEQFYKWTGYMPNGSDWHNITAVWNGRKLKVFLDGEENNGSQDTIPEGTVILNSASGLNISSGGSETMRGYLDDVRVYDRALTNEEIIKIARAHAPIPLAGHCVALPQSPANDNFQNAANMTTLPFTVSLADTSMATRQVSEPYGTCGADSGKSVWYQYTAPRDGKITLSTANSDYRNILTVYTGSTLGALTEAKCNAGFGTGSYLNLTVSQGTTYFIQISGQEDQAMDEPYSGALNFNAVLEPGPANDNFDNANFLMPGVYQQIADFYPATLETDEPMPDITCGSVGKSVWYKYTATDISMVKLETKYSHFDTVLGVYTGSSLASLTKLACNDDDPVGGTTSALAFMSKPGVTYYIQAGAQPGLTGDSNSLFNIQLFSSSCLAGTAGFGNTYQGTLNTTSSTGNCVDPYTGIPARVYSLAGAAGKVAAISLAGADYSYPFLELYNSAGSKIAEGSFCTETDSTNKYNRACLNYEITLNGNYYLLVSHTQSLSAAWPYTLSLRDFSMTCPWAYWPLDSIMPYVEEGVTSYYAPEALRAPNNPNLWLAMVLNDNISLNAAGFPNPLFPNAGSLLLARAGQGKGAGYTTAWPQDTNIFTGNQVTLSLWVNHAEMPGSGRPIQRYVSLTDETAVIRATNSGWQFYISAQSPGDNGYKIKDIVASTGPSAGTWYHLAGVWDGSQLKIYVNGQLNVSAPLPSGTIIKNTINTVSLSNPTDEAMEGHLDDVRVYNTALSATEIQALADRAPVPASCYTPAP